VLREQPSCFAIDLTPSPLRAITRISTACSWVNIDGSGKAAILSQVGQIYSVVWVSFTSSPTDIEAGILVPGQRVLTNTLRQCIELFPDARSTMLTNVLHEPTRSMMLTHPDTQPDAPFTADSTAGPLARGLAGAGFEALAVVPEGGRRTYIGLRGSRRAAVPLPPGTRDTGLRRPVPRHVQCEALQPERLLARRVGTDTRRHHGRLVL